MRLACGPGPDSLLLRALDPGARVTRTSEPMFNVPTVVLAILAALFVLVQAVRELGADRRAELDVLFYFAFIPARYDALAAAARKLSRAGSGRRSGPSSPTRSFMATSCISA